MNDRSNKDNKLTMNMIIYLPCLEEFLPPTKTIRSGDTWWGGGFFSRKPIFYVTMVILVTFGQVGVNIF